MSLALFFVSQVFSKPGKIERAIKRIFITGFILTLVSLIIIGSQYGINREYRFEVAAITINWMVMIISGIPMSILFKRALG
ncbi:MAG: hypothetical protein GX550_05175 [Syntrophomonadaceae bacterium]|nr:hypothetical protein [Syntrophomonadaceae bacterium]